MTKLCLVVSKANIKIRVLPITQSTQLHHLCLLGLHEYYNYTYVVLILLRLRLLLMFILLKVVTPYDYLLSRIAYKVRVSLLSTYIH